MNRVLYIWENPLMKKIYTIVLLILCCVRVGAQVNGYPSKIMACNGSGSGAFARGVGNITGSFWQSSADNGASWVNVPAGYQYIEGGNGYLDMYYTPVASAMNLWLFRMCNPGTPNACSIPDTLYVNSGVATSPQFVGPPSTVCPGNTILLSVTGGAAGLTNDSISWGIIVNGSIISSFTDLNDTNLVVHIPATATGTATINVSVSTGCSFASAAPLNVSVQSSSTSLAGTAGGGAVCTSFPVYPGGQSSYNPDPAQTSTATDGTCDAIASILPSGTSPVTGTLQSCVTLAMSVPTYEGIPYVPRYYSIEPTTNASTSTATVTLYFTQADFDAYNAVAGSNPLLPTGPSDATGISHLVISQFHGTGTTPDTYVGGSVQIDPGVSNVVWNATASRWEVTFSVTGFSGFFASGSPIVPLPLTLTNFSGKAEAGANVLSWITASEQNTAYFEVQRSVTGASSFQELGRVAAAGNSEQSLQYSYADALASSNHPAYSYRLKMADLDGKYTYSPIVTLQPLVAGLTISVSPNPFLQPVSLNVSTPAAGSAVFSVTDMSGQRLVVRNVVLQQGVNALDPSLIARLPQGVYVISVATQTQQETIKFVKE